jgi:hypothetical protein
MRNCRIVLLLSFGVCIFAQAEPVVVPSLGPRYKQTRERVEELFRYRNGKVPAPDPKTNLFRVAPYNTVLPDLPVQTTKSEEPSAPDEVILRLAVATLKGGTLTIGGQSYLSVNKKRYQEGDRIVTKVHDKPVVLILKRLAQKTATLSLNEAEIVVQF